MGTEIDYQKAYEYFEQSDNPYAQYSLGVMYQRDQVLIKIMKMHLIILNSQQQMEMFMETMNLQDIMIMESDVKKMNIQPVAIIKKPIIHFKK